MGAVTTEARGLPLTRAELEAIREEREDGRRYELLDGVLLVSPAPRRVHQRALMRLLRRLDDACPKEYEILPAPFDVTLADDTVLQPDIVVGRRTDYTDRDLPTAPVLAVEVLSPSTRRFDRLLKRSRYEAAGTRSYWIVDPDGPSLTAWTLSSGRYVEVATVRGNDAFTAAEPFATTIVPTDLTSD
jgi:Uma2 family endonuclease